MKENSFTNFSLRVVHNPRRLEKLGLKCSFIVFRSERTSKSAAVRMYAPKISTNGFTINHIYFLKAHDPNNPLTLIDDKDNDKYTHKYTHTQIHK